MKKLIIYDVWIFFAYIFAKIISGIYYLEVFNSNNKVFLIFTILFMYIVNYKKKTEKLTGFEILKISIYAAILVYNGFFRNAYIIIENLSIESFFLESLFYFPLGLMFNSIKLKKAIQIFFFISFLISFVWFFNFGFSNNISLFIIFLSRLIGVLSGYFYKKIRNILTKKNELF